MVGRSGIKGMVLAIVKPPKAVVALALPVIAAMMAWVFALGNEEHPLSYVAYVASFYLLVVLGVWAVTCLPAMCVRQMAKRSRLIAGVIDDEGRRWALSLRAGIAADVLWAASNLLFATASAPAWFITLGCYYLLFAVVRILLLRRILARRGEGSDAGEAAGRRKDCQTARLCGVGMMATVLVLSGIVTLAVRGEHAIRYGEISAIALAVFVFYTVASSLVMRLRMRDGHTLVLKANARVNLAIALVSLLTLEIALLSTFGGEGDAPLMLIMPILTGAAIACALLGMGAATFIEANREMPD